MRSRYRDQHGVSFRLKGLERGLDDRAEARARVIELIRDGTVVDSFHSSIA